MNKKVYVVRSYGGYWEDKWDKNEAVFSTRDKAEAFIKESEELDKKITKELYDEIEEFLNEKADEIYNKYYDENDELIDPTSLEAYKKEYDSFDTEGKYDLVYEKYGITRDEYDNAEDHVNYEFHGYMIDELEYYE